MTKKWHIREGLYLEAALHEIFLLIDDADEVGISFHADEIDDLISGLRGVKTHYNTERLKEKEEEKLAAWGKTKTPTDINQLETSY